MSRSRDQKQTLYTTRIYLVPRLLDGFIRPPYLRGLRAQAALDLGVGVMGNDFGLFRLILLKQQEDGTTIYPRSVKLLRFDLYLLKGQSIVALQVAPLG